MDDIVITGDDGQKISELETAKKFQTKDLGDNMFGALR